MLVVSEGMRYLARLMTYSMHKFYHPPRTISLQLQRRIFNNIYNMASHISHYIVMSGIINPDGLESPILSDELTCCILTGLVCWLASISCYYL
jgi:hypothetical protein